VNEGYVLQTLAELKELYTNLFLLMERSLALSADDADGEARLAKLNAEIATRMQVADGRARRLRHELGDWRRREDVPADLRRQVDEFLDLLDQGLNALQSQIEKRVSALREQQGELAKAIRHLQRSRHGMRQYRSAGRPSKLLDSEA